MHARLPELWTHFLLVYLGKTICGGIGWIESSCITCLHDHTDKIQGLHFTASRQVRTTEKQDCKTSSRSQVWKGGTLQQLSRLPKRFLRAFVYPCFSRFIRSAAWHQVIYRTLSISSISKVVAALPLDNLMTDSKIYVNPFGVWTELSLHYW